MRVGVHCPLRQEGSDPPCNALCVRGHALPREARGARQQESGALQLLAATTGVALGARPCGAAPGNLGEATLNPKP